MLGGNHHSVHPGRNTVLVFHCHLGLSIGAEIGQNLLFAHLGQLAAQLMGQHNGHGHQLGGLIAGKAEHHALIPGAVVLVLLRLAFGFQRTVHAHGDIAGLLVNGGDDGTGVAVKTVLGPVITDLAHHFPSDVGNVRIATGGNLAHHIDHAGGAGGLTGHPGLGIFFQNGVQHRIGNLVADFVGMSLGHRFRGKESFFHGYASFLCFHSVQVEPMPDRQKKRPARRSVISRRSLISRYTTAGFGTLQKCRLPGFIGPFPPPLLIRL